MRVNNSPQPAPQRPFRHVRLWVTVLLLCAIALVTLMVRFGGQNQTSSVGMDGRLVTPDPDARVSAQDAALMNVTSTPYQLTVPSVDLNVGVAAMSALGDTITPPGFSEAFWVRNVGVSPEHAAEGTVVVAAHSVRGGGIGPGNYLIDIPAASSRVKSGARITLGNDQYRVTGSAVYSKTSLADMSGVWANVPGRLQLITCLQRADGRVSVDNLVITAQLDNAAVTANPTARAAVQAAGGNAPTAVTAQPAATGHPAAAGNAQSAVDIRPGAEVMPAAQLRSKRIAAHTVAQGSDPLDQSNPRYHSWNSSQYDNPKPMSGNGDQIYTMHLSTMDTRALQTTHFAYPGLRPADAIYQKSVIVNDFRYPVTVRYVGGSDEGTVAPYLFEWLTGWNDTTLQPGQSTAVFQLQMGMPWDASGGAAGTSGQFWWEWEVHRLPVPTNPPTAPEVTGFSVHTGGGVVDSAPGSAAATAATMPGIVIPAIDAGLATRPGTSCFGTVCFVAARLNTTLTRRLATTTSLTVTKAAPVWPDRQSHWNRSFS